MRPGRTAAALLALGLCTVTACADDGPPTATPRSSSPSPSAPATPSAAASTPAPVRSVSPSAPATGPAVPAALPCPASYARPDPTRPVVTAAVTFAPGGVVTGTERVVFTPDLRVTELVFRLWGQAPRPARAGGRVSTGQVSVDGRGVASTRASATLLRVPLAAPVEAGRAVTIDVPFRLQLPTGVNDRYGVRGETMWFGSGLPLLAWERGRGWAVEPPTTAFAEAATSEVAQLAELAVTRPAGLTVLAPGTPVSDDGRTARFRAAAVRDVAVAVGRFRTTTVSAGGVPVVVGVAPQVRDSAAVVATELARSLKVHAARFGPFPFERLVTAVVPDLRGGVEFPGFVLLGTGQAQGDATGSHEVAHEWFYGLLGDNQARDPWLDEAFATYAEALDRGTGPRYRSTAAPTIGRQQVGRPMAFWEADTSAYYRSVYVQGAAALLRARDRVGAAAFDTALRCHARRNAQRITGPADLTASLQHLPAAVAELRRAGAL